MAKNPLNDPKYDALNMRTKEALWLASELICEQVFDFFPEKFENLRLEQEKVDSRTGEAAGLVTASRAEKAKVDAAIEEARVVLASIQEQIRFERKIEADVKKNLDLLKKETDDALTEGRRKTFESDFARATASKAAASGAKSVQR